MGRVSSLENTDAIMTPDMAAKLRASLQSNNVQDFLLALRDAVKSNGVAKVAEKASLSKFGLYKAITPGRVPQFDTILGVLRALGFSLDLQEPQRIINFKTNQKDYSRDLSSSVDYKPYEKWGTEVGGLLRKATESAKKSDFVAAEEYCLNARKLDAACWPAIIQQGIAIVYDCLDKGEAKRRAVIEEARKLFKTIITDFPAIPDALSLVYANLGWLVFLEKGPEDHVGLIDRIRCYQNALIARPSYLHCRALLCICYVFLDEISDANVHYLNIDADKRALFHRLLLDKFATMGRVDPVINKRFYDWLKEKIDPEEE